ncbi:HK97 gp10 family phage protein [Pectinatus frisingensis]|uniref:HK97 gp10 family phage protein n=1 Tax=Pectinatus frisingensis TaxID=865 RepID=UPI0018C69479|nr:HK97 gp10 family phage protein [Pectinatus frisingensis]
MSDSGFYFDSLDDFKQQIIDVANAFPATTEKHLKKTGNKMKKMLKVDSPDGADNSSIKDNKERKKADSKKLKNSWKSEVKGYTGEELQMDIYSKSKHFHLVDRGHVQKTKDGKVVGFTQGKHFLEKTAQYVETNILPDEMEKLYKDISKKLGD